MPVIRYPDGTEVYIDEPIGDDEPPAHLRRGRFDKRRRKGESERQRLERGLGKMAEIGKEFLLDDDKDDIGVIARMLQAKKVIE